MATRWASLRARGQHLGQGEFGKVLHINAPSRSL
jgi:hypothetical protein